MADDDGLVLAESTAGLLAAEVRRRRQVAQLSHSELAARVGYTRQYISLAERPRKGLPSADLVRALDKALDADGALVTLRDAAVRARQALRGARASAARTIVPTDGVPGLGREPVSVGEAVAMAAPAGRYFPGTSIPVTTLPIHNDGRVVAIVPSGFADDPFLQRPRRGLVVGLSTDMTESAAYAMDARLARERLVRGSESRLLMPRAYELDDLTVGILWALANLDEALLDDDTNLSERWQGRHTYEKLPRSAAGQEFAAELSSVAQMWLGSEFCASHILRHLREGSQPPVFWTREQYGEEASTWLFFRHKLAYLRNTSRSGVRPEERPRRAFCIPPDAVATSNTPERVLLFLAVALMESFGIAVDVNSEPEYSAAPGFVLDGERRAIVANWVRNDSIWQVDVTTSPSLLGEFHDATGFARAHSVVRGETAKDRLHALADYLRLDWDWLTRRCHELGDQGVLGLGRPRSRLLSPDGLDQACRFVGLQGGEDR